MTKQDLSNIPINAGSFKETRRRQHLCFKELDFAAKLKKCAELTAFSDKWSSLKDTPKS